MKPIDVLFFSVEDWANVGYGFAESLKSVGVEAHSFTMNPHILGYERQAEPYDTFVRLKKVIEASKCIVFMHSDPVFLKLPFDLNGKKKVVFHGGSTYRNNSKPLNEMFNPFVDICLVQTGDLRGLGAKNEKWIYPAIDVEAIKPTKGLSTRAVLAHFPRGPEVKGTKEILDVVEELKGEFEFDFLHDARNVDHKNNLERIDKCDIYIEAMQPKLDGKKYGEWGVTALEAASMGKIVVSHFFSKYKYEKEFDICPIFTVNNKYDLKTQLTNILLFKSWEVRKVQEDTRNWVVKNHSYEPTGRRLKRLLELND
jgi:hypothetical protein